MPLQENTVEGWSGVITELTTKRQSLLQNLARSSTSNRQAVLPGVS